MRLFRALADFFTDLGNGDPVALIIAGVVLIVLLLVGAIWIAELRRRKREREAEEKKRNARKSSGISLRP